LIGYTEANKQCRTKEPKKKPDGLEKSNMQSYSLKVVKLIKVCWPEFLFNQ